MRRHAAITAFATSTTSAYTNSIDKTSSGV
jgi:hypothetical protein